MQAEKIAETRKRWKAICEKVGNKKESFQVVDDADVDKFHDRIIKLAKRSSRAYNSAKNYVVR